MLRSNAEVQSGERWKTMVTTVCYLQTDSRLGLSVRLLTPLPGD